MQRADIDIGTPGAHAIGQAALGNVGVNESADILVALAAREPQAVERMEDGARHLERAPNPVGARLGRLDLDLRHTAIALGHHGIEKSWMLDREKQERQRLVTERT